MFTVGTATRKWITLLVGIVVRTVIYLSKRKCINMNSCLDCKYYKEVERLTQVNGTKVITKKDVCGLFEVVLHNLKPCEKGIDKEE